MVVLMVTSIGLYKRSRRNRPTQPEGDVNTQNTEENIALREQTIPLITEGGVDAHDTRETFSLGPRHELGEFVCLSSSFNSWIALMRKSEF